MPPRGRPDLIIAATRIEPNEQIIAYMIKIGYALNALLAREQRSEDVAELLEIAAAAGAAKHIAQQQREKDFT
jgi:hypothetical protein